MKRHHTIIASTQSAFTLVELAIVLVIIGLIVGGVLVGQDLIKAAEIRSTVAELERYNAAANTFRNKYDGLPGDLLSGRAAQFSLDARDGTLGHGDGNSVVEGCRARVTALGCETALFWADLTKTQLISDSFTVGTGANDGIADGNSSGDNISTVGAMARYIPTTTLRDSSFVHIFPHRGRNFYYMGNLVTDGLGEIIVNNFDATPGLSVAEASQIDDKMDDGAPTTGIVQVIQSEGGNGMTVDAGFIMEPGSSATPITGACVLQGLDATIQSDESYNTGDDVAGNNFADELNCNLTIRTSF